MAVQSLFANLDFEEVDPSGVPASWRCFCGSTVVACRTQTSNVKNGARALALASGCSAFQQTKAFDDSKGVRFQLSVANGLLYPPDARLFATVGSDYVNPVDLAQVPIVEAFAHGTPEWRSVRGTSAIGTHGADTVTLWITNSNGLVDRELGLATDAGDMIVDGVVVTSEAAPAPPIGALLRGWHIENDSLAAKDAPTAIYLPLPLDWASQVPLDVELSVSPSGAAERIEYVAQGAQNWGAIVHFAPATKAGSVQIRWDAVVLVRDVSLAERPTVFAALPGTDNAPDRWLVPTRLATSTYAPLAAVAQRVAPPAATPVDRILGIVGWTSTTLGAPGTPDALDSRSVFDTHVTSCTGFANTASALGRASGVPARAIANILVDGGTQDIHSVNELYAGAEWGWRRVEPQAKAPLVPDSYGLVMHVVTPEDESDDAMSDARWALPGVPLDTITEAREGRDRLAAGLAPVSAFADYRYGQNRADRQAVLRASERTELAVLFDRARTAWQNDVASLTVSRTIPAARSAVRHRALAAKTVADVRAIVDALSNAR